MSRSLPPAWALTCALPCRPAQMIELLGEIPPEVATEGRYAGEFFTPDGRLRHITSLNRWPLDRVLAEKYGLPEEEVRRGRRRGCRAGPLLWRLGVVGARVAGRNGWQAQAQREWLQRVPLPGESAVPAPLCIFC